MQSSLGHLSIFFVQILKVNSQVYFRYYFVTGLSIFVFKNILAGKSWSLMDEFRNLKNRHVYCNWLILNPVTLHTAECRVQNKPWVLLQSFHFNFTSWSIKFSPFVLLSSFNLTHHWILEWLAVAFCIPRMCLNGLHIFEM